MMPEDYFVCPVCSGGFCGPGPSCDKCQAKLAGATSEDEAFASTYGLAPLGLKALVEYRSAAEERGKLRADSASLHAQEAARQELKALQRSIPAIIDQIKRDAQTAVAIYKDQLDVAQRQIDQLTTDVKHWELRLASKEEWITNTGKLLEEIGKLVGLRNVGFKAPEQILEAVYATCQAERALDAQIDKLATFIQDEVPGEPSQDQGAVDTAIRVIRALQGAAALPLRSQRLYIARMELVHSKHLKDAADARVELLERFADTEAKLDNALNLLALRAAADADK